MDTNPRGANARELPALLRWVNAACRRRRLSMSVLMKDLSSLLIQSVGSRRPRRPGPRGQLCLQFAHALFGQRLFAGRAVLPKPALVLFLLLLFDLLPALLVGHALRPVLGEADRAGPAVPRFRHPAGRLVVPRRPSENQDALEIPVWLQGRTQALVRDVL